MKKINTIGQRYGRLTPIEELGVFVMCVCDCGEEKQVRRINLLAGYTQSCGCLNRERTSEANTTHGMSRTSIYGVWRQMHTRCYNKNHRAYPWYGGKGIEVCLHWHTFENFYEDMAEGYSIGLTLDRRESNDNYYKDNCRWLTKNQNSSRRF